MGRLIKRDCSYQRTHILQVKTNDKNNFSKRLRRNKVQNNDTLSNRTTYNKKEYIEIEKQSEIEFYKKTERLKKERLERELAKANITWEENERRYRENQKKNSETRQRKIKEMKEKESESDEFFARMDKLYSK